MTAPVAEGIALATALGAAVVAGVFFAFSSFVMRALARLDPPAGIAAMQAINRVVINPAFLGVFLGTALLGVALLLLAASGQAGDRALPLAAGAALYLLGCFGVTMLANVPRNEALARLDPRDPASDAPWRAYVRSWTAWNHLRCAAALLAAAALVIGLR